jgi:hypothetical protein
VITGASSVGLGTRSWSNSSATNSWVTFSPGLDVFVLKNFSVGVSLDVEFGNAKGYLADGTPVEVSSTTYRGGPRLGVNLPLAPRLSLYPQLLAGYESERMTEQAVGTGGSGAAAHDGPWAAVDVPLVFEPKPHFFVALVPSATVDGSSGQGNAESGGPYTSFGVGFLVGGWLGGRQPPPEPPPEVTQGEPLAPLPRFGDKGVVVLNSELNAFGFGTHYTGAASSTYTGYGLDAGLDYFIVDHVSFGAVLSVEHYEAAGNSLLDAAVYTKSETRAGIGLRLGAELPLGRYLSLYPRGTLGFGAEDFDLESRGSASKGSDSYFYADLYVPLLVHLARHFFVGFGPEVYTDLGRTYQPSGRTDLSTVLDAGLIVGGWL